MEISGAGPPPPGVKPNFEHPESIGYRIIIGSVVCWWSATLVLFLRLYARRNVTHIIAAEDYILFVGWILSLAHSAVIIAWVKHGAGIHFWDFPTTMLNSFINLDIAESAFYGASTLCIKLSILLFLPRLTPYGRFRILLYLICVITTIYCLISVFQFAFDWYHAPNVRDSIIPTGSCSGPLPLYVAIDGMNMGTDILLLLLPIAMVWNIQFTGNERLGVILIFALGSSVCIASIVRFTIQVVEYHASEDSWVKAIFLPLDNFEINLGIICACLPHLRVLVRRITPCTIWSKSLVRRLTPSTPWRRSPEESPANSDITSPSRPTQAFVGLSAPMTELRSGSDMTACA